MGSACRSARVNEHIVIGAHGTLKNWVSKRVLSTEHVRILVFDEADEMLKVRNFLFCDPVEGWWYGF